MTQTLVEINIYVMKIQYFHSDSFTVSICLNILYAYKYKVYNFHPVKIKCFLCACTLILLCLSYSNKDRFEYKKIVFVMPSSNDRSYYVRKSVIVMPFTAPIYAHTQFHT